MRYLTVLQSAGKRKGGAMRSGRRGLKVAGYVRTGRHYTIQVKSGQRESSVRCYGRKEAQLSIWKLS